MTRISRFLMVAWLAATAAGSAGAQTVYKCQVQGKVVYSHDPCLGAQVIDTTPTQGLDRSSGRSLKGQDVIRAEQQKMFADAVKPITGMDAAELQKAGRRLKLPQPAQLECSRLDAQMPEQEREAGAVNKESAQRAAAVLFQSRIRFRDLGC